MNFAQPAPRLLLLTPLALALFGGCGFIGIEPDEIDIADEDTGEDDLGGDTEGAGSSDEIGDTGGGDEGENETGTGTSSDSGDETEGDTSDTGDATDTGDSGLDSSCGEFDPTEVFLDTPLAFEIPEGESVLSSDCGADGPELVFFFTADEDGTYSFDPGAQAIPLAIYVVTECVPLEELSCNDGGATQTDLVADQTVFVIVDADSAPAPGTLTVTKL
ncbi:hypothetical protein G6O69_11005 [Pseudenhygromyxa sp. WMMC2535]|uniref:hypothetical protein n=1 Tax=Pseudenhygromyxa sp. WMMC2535 TaxID=2712867 RepID=UPI00155299D6|nr:hypothetical protein [Pseudenhygromyxa sp. WMMC2535]NVB38359.1 hypothetical protein [Pseudenhygromyxa sp. WMMC2535]